MGIPLVQTQALRAVCFFLSDCRCSILFPPIDHAMQLRSPCIVNFREDLLRCQRWVAEGAGLEGVNIIRDGLRGWNLSGMDCGMEIYQGWLAAHVRVRELCGWDIETHV